MRPEIDAEVLARLKRETSEQLQRIMIVAMFSDRVFRELVNSALSELLKVDGLPEEGKGIIFRLVKEWNHYDGVRMSQIGETLKPGEHVTKLPNMSMPQVPWHAPALTVETFEQMTPGETLDLFKHLASAWHGMTASNNELIRRLASAPGTRAEHMEILNQWSTVIEELQQTSSGIAERMTATVN